MNKRELKHHAQAITEAYEALSAVWADIGVINAAFDSNKLPAAWMIEEILKRDWGIIGDNLLALTDFMDAMNKEETK